MNYAKAPFPWVEPDTPEEHAESLLRYGVWSVDEGGAVFRHAKRTRVGWKRIKPRRIDSGRERYRSVRFQHHGRVVNVKAHRVAWIAHHGQIPDGLQVNHKNLDRHDNRLPNLELVTASQNIRHSYDNGRTRPHALTTAWRGRPRISDAQILEIAAMRRMGVIYREIAKRFGISITHAQRLAQRGELQG